MKHKHSETIKAFANGIECEWFDSLNNKWHLIRELKEFDWVDTVRIKPEPKPDIVRYYNITQFGTIYEHNNSKNWDLKVTFDGETSKPKNAEVIKNV